MAEKTLEDLARGIVRCRACGLSKTRNRAVPGEGPADAPLMLIGEAPGEVEDKLGRPFTGRTGNFFTPFLAENGINREEVFLTAAAKCHPPRNRDPKREEMAICGEKWLLPQIRLIRPRLILLMGLCAARQNFPEEVAEAGSLAGMLGREFRLDNIPCRVTYHPTAAMRFRGLRDKMALDLALARDLAWD